MGVGATSPSRKGTRTAQRTAFAILCALLFAPSGLPSGLASPSPYSCGWSEANDPRTSYYNYYGEHASGVADLRAVMIGDGSVIVAWREVSDVESPLFAARVLASGDIVEVTQITGPDNETTSEIDLAANEAGDAIVAWEDPSAGLFSRRRDVQGQWAPALQIVNGSLRPAHEKIAVDPAGVAVAAWIAVEQNQGIVYGSTDRGGGGWSEPVLIDGNRVDSAGLAIGGDDQSNVTIGYLARGPTGTAQPKVARFSQASGWSLPEALSAGNATHWNNVFVGVSPGGATLAVWIEDNPPEESGIHAPAQSVFAAWAQPGGGWSRERLVSGAGLDMGRIVNIVGSVTANGRAFLTWGQQYRDMTIPGALATFSEGAGWSVRAGPQFEAGFGGRVMGLVARPDETALAVGAENFFSSSRVVGFGFASATGWGAGEPLGMGTRPVLVTNRAFDEAVVWLNGTLSIARRDGAGSWSAEARIHSNHIGAILAVSTATASPYQGGGVVTAFIRHTSSHTSLAAYYGRAGGGFFSPSQPLGVLLPVLQGVGVNESEPATAIDSLGRATVVVLQSDGARTRVWAARYFPEEVSQWGGRVPLDAASGGNASAPRVAVDEAGNTWVVWREDRLGGSRILGARNDLNGPWQAPVELSTAPAAPFSSPSLAALGQGRFMVAWVQGEGSAAAVMARRVGGSLLDSPSTLSAPGAGVRGAPQVVAPTGSSAAVFWVQGEGALVESSWKEPTGWSSPVQVADGVVGLSFGAAVDGRGTLAAAWAQGVPGQWVVRSRIHPPSREWWPARDVGASNGSLEPQLLMRMDPGSNTTLVWTEVNATNASIFTAQFSSLGGWSAPVHLRFINGMGDGRALISSMSLAQDQYGGAYLLWGEDSETGPSLMRAQRYPCYDYDPSPPLYAYVGVAAVLVGLVVAATWVRRFRRASRPPGPY